MVLPARLDVTFCQVCPTPIICEVEGACHTAALPFDVKTVPAMPTFVNPVPPLLIARGVNKLVIDKLEIAAPVMVPPEIATAVLFCVAIVPNVPTALATNAVVAT